MIQKSKGILIVLSGFSGSGKGTIMKENELTYELICAAVNGDREALDQILIYYDDYINTLATVKAEDAQGNEYGMVRAVREF